MYRKWDYADFRNNIAEGMNATTAQVIKLLLCPSDALPEPVLHFNSAYAPQYAWAYGYYGMTSNGGNAGRLSFTAGNANRPPRMTASFSRTAMFAWRT